MFFLLKIVITPYIIYSSLLNLNRHSSAYSSYRLEHYHIFLLSHIKIWIAIIHFAAISLPSYPSHIMKIKPSRIHIGLTTRLLVNRHQHPQDDVKKKSWKSSRKDSEQKPDNTCCISVEAQIIGNTCTDTRQPNILCWTSQSFVVHICKIIIDWKCE